MKKMMPGLLAAGVLVVSLAHADEIVKPHTFSAGTPAQAAQVNANFDLLYNQVNKIGGAITVAGGGQIGIGTQTPGAELEVVGGAADTQGAVRVANPSLNTAAYLGGTDGVYGEAAGNSAGVYGRNNNPDGSANVGFGVKGVSTSNIGGLGVNQVCTQEPYDCNCDWDTNTQQEVCDTCYQTVCTAMPGAGVYGQATAPALAGYFAGNVTTTGQLGTGSAAVSGQVSAGSAVVSGQMGAGSVTVTGQMHAGSAAVTGALSAGSATVSGQMSAGSATVSGQLSAGSATVTGQISAASYAGNGAGLTNTQLKWQEVTASSRQALSNTGYLANSAVSPVVITLPVAPAVGDIVRLSGIGAGGWKIAQNPGQSVITRNIPIIGNTWSAHESSKMWRAMAASADGTKLVAVESGGTIYNSTDSGATWTNRVTLDRWWTAVASSADGTHLVAVYNGLLNYGDGGILTSTDSGAHWGYPMAYWQPLNWSGVALSADGSKLVAVAEGAQIYTSTDFGNHWSIQEAVRDWYGVASSADGSKLVALEKNGPLYTSTDSGLSWTPRMTDANRYWQAVASSADGTKLIAGVYGGQLYTSTDSGVSWTPRMTDANRNWQSVASSGDGSRLMAGVRDGQLYTSTDSGVSWTPQLTEANRNWQGVAISAGGTKLVAMDTSGESFISSPSEQGNRTTSVGTGGSLSGGQYDSAEVQYVGNNQFLLLSHEGYLDLK